MTYKQQAQEWHQQWFSERKLRLDADSRIATLERENEALKSKVGFYESVSPQDIVDEANRPEPVAIKEQSKC